MPTPKKIDAYLPGKGPEPEYRNFQARVERGLYERAKAKAQADGYTWEELAKGLLQFYLQETPDRPKG